MDNDVVEMTVSVEIDRQQMRVLMLMLSSGSCLPRGREGCAPRLGRAILLLRAPGLAGDRHLDEAGVEERRKNLIPELGPVRAPGWSHQFRKRPGFDSKFEHLSLVLT